MFDFIARLQQKPERERKAIVVFASFGGTFLVVLVWLTTMVVQMEQSKVVVTDADIAAQKKVVSAETSPLDSLKQSAASVGSAFDRFKNFFGGVGTVKYDNK